MTALLPKLYNIFEVNYDRISVFKTSVLRVGSSVCIGKLTWYYVFELIERTNMLK